MPAILHSTNDVPAREAFAYWNDCVCEAFVNLDCLCPETETFSGSIHSWLFSSLNLTTMVSDRMELRRSPQRIAKAREDCFLVALESRTGSALVQDGREGILHPGDFALVDSVRPYTVLFNEGFEHRVLRIPRRDLLRRIAPVDSLTGITICGSTGAGRLASLLIQALPAELPTLDDVAQEQVAQTLLDLLAVAIGSAAQGAPVHESSTRTAWFARIRSYIESNLGDPELSRTAIAAALGVSVRYVSAIFGANKLSVGDYIWERRLSKCHAALSDPSQRGRTISSIAFGWGFNDMSHFSRVFRSRYGLSPREFREQTMKGPALFSSVVDHA